MGNKHEKRKITIFNAFAQCCSLQISPDSILKMAPPKPDIECEAKGICLLSFELVEIIERRYANLLGKNYRTRNKLSEYYSFLPQHQKDEFDKSYLNAMIYPQFENTLTLRQRIKLFPKIFDCLLSLDPQFDGDACQDVPEFKGKLKGIGVSRGLFKGPIFDQPFADSIDDPTIKTLNSKFQKKYQKNNTLHLLAYIDLNPMFLDDIWLNGVKDFVGKSLRKSQFEKVWIFDFKQSVIKFVYP